MDVQIPEVEEIDKFINHIANKLYLKNIASKSISYVSTSFHLSNVPGITSSLTDFTPLTTLCPLHDLHRFYKKENILFGPHQQAY